MKQIISNLKTNLPKKRIEKEFPYASSILLVLILAVVFVIPVFPKIYDTLFYPLLISGVFISAVFSIRRNHLFLVIAAFLLIIAIWISIFSKMDTYKTIFKIVQFIFFLFIVGNLIAQISSIESPTLQVIIESITGYLLLGFSFSIVVTIITDWIPNAYNVVFIQNLRDPISESTHNNIYYTFVTFSTTGYGDILPNHPLAKSLAVLISISGQLYIAIIIAMLVGKYASSACKDK